MLLVGARKYERSGDTPSVCACCAGLATADSGRPPFLADRGVFRREMYILGLLLFLPESSAWSYTKEVHITSIMILGHRNRRPIAMNHEGFSMMLLRERCIVV